MSKEIIAKTVTTEELKNIFMNKEKGTWTYLKTVTKVRMNKTGNPYFGQITKTSYLNVLIGNNYQTRVINETGNPDFVPEHNRVGDHVSKCVLFNEKTGKHYLQLEYFDYSKIPNYPPQFIPPKPEYSYNGDPIEMSLFQSYMVKKSENKYGVNWLSVTIDNIKECHVDGVHYTVVNPVTVEQTEQTTVEVE